MYEITVFEIALLQVLFFLIDDFRRTGKVKCQICGNPATTAQQQPKNSS